MPVTFINKNVAAESFNAAGAARRKEDADRLALSERRRKAAQAVGLDTAGREAVKAHLAGLATDAGTQVLPSAPFAGEGPADPLGEELASGAAVSGIAPAGGPSTAPLRSARPARAPAARFQADLARRLASTPGGGAGAVSAITAGQTAQTAFEKQQLEFETSTYEELYKGNIEAALAAARRAGITIPPEVLASERTRKMVGGAMAAASKFYKNPQQLGKFVAALMASGGDWQVAWQQVGPPTETPNLKYQVVVEGAKAYLALLSRDAEGKVTTTPVPGLDGAGKLQVPLPRGAKRAGFTPTPPQARDNNVIGVSRQWIRDWLKANRREGETASAALKRAAAKTHPLTNFENPHYQPLVDRNLRAASKSMTGPDDDYAAFREEILEGLTTKPPPAAEPPPAAAPDSGSVFDETMNMDEFKTFLLDHLPPAARDIDRTVQSALFGDGDLGTLANPIQELQRREDLQHDKVYVFKKYPGKKFRYDANRQDPKTGRQGVLVEATE